MIWQARISREKNKHYLQAYLAQCGPIKSVQFDDLVTFEHTKCKPLTVPMALIDEKRVLLGFRVASIPAFGHLAALSRQRYGRRTDHSRRERRDLFAYLSEILPADVSFKTDGHDHYAHLIRTYFPAAEYSVYKSERGSVPARS